MINGNIIAFDFGTSNIGVAIGQCITNTANPLTVIKHHRSDQLNNIIKEWNPSLIIVGLPLNMNGIKNNIITNQVLNFAKKLFLTFKIKVILHDERLSTIEARARLFKFGGYRALNKHKLLDDKSAVVILESWLEQFKGQDKGLHEL